MIKLWTRDSNGNRVIQDIPRVEDLPEGNSDNNSLGWTGRMYLYANRWSTFHYTYGYTYFQNFQNVGTGTTPSYSTSLSLGNQVTKEGKITDIVFTNHVNTNESSTQEYSLDIIRGNQIINVSTWSDNTLITTNRTKIISGLNVDIQVGDQIMLAGRKVGSGSTRYSSYSINFNIEY